jgi:two-component system chemotaxis response regulator CheB
MEAPLSGTRPAEVQLQPTALRDGHYQAVAIGCSAGGLEALKAIFTGIPADYSIPLLLVQHLHATDGGRFAAHLNQALALTVVEAVDKLPVSPGNLYVAPADYHMLVECNGSIALSADEKVNSSRPAIDVLFESAARVWADRLACLVLSGANYDGAAGALLARSLGGLVVAQEPSTAAVPTMPQSVITRNAASYVLPPAGIAHLLLKLEQGRIAEGEEL